MYVEFWDVNAAKASTLLLTASEVSAHLLADWTPSLPASVGSSFIGWPPFLLDVVDWQGKKYLTLREETRRSERQWKSVLSWMLGIAGTRCFLASDNYRWIAPTSAFYPEAIQPVDLTLWHPSFPRTSLEVTRLEGNHSRLRPDYLALRSTASIKGTQHYEWAVVEAKGTDTCLTSLSTCPKEWSNQASNAVVKVNGSEIAIQRRLVVASRVNPNALRSKTRRIQVRAWNHQRTQQKLPSDAVVDIVAAHLFGLFRSLHLPKNALAIASSAKLRREDPDKRLPGDLAKANKIFKEAEQELQQRTREIDITRTNRTSTLQTELGTVEANFSDAIIELSRDLQSRLSVHDAAASISKADKLLDKWESYIRENRDRNRVVLPFGLELTFPEDFERP